MAELKIGDVVLLKSGGPSMTVEEIGDYEFVGRRAKCTWFEGKKRHSDLFVIETLEPPPVPSAPFVVR